MKTQADLLKYFYSLGSSRSLCPVQLATYLRWINEGK